MNLDWPEIKKANWYHQRTDSLPCFTIGPTYGVLKLFRSSGKCIFHFNKDFFEAFFAEEFFYSEARRIMRQYQASPESLKKYHDFWLKRASILEEKINTVAKGDLNKITNNELIKNYKNIDGQSRRLWQTPLFMDIFDTNFPEFLNNEFKIYSSKPTIEEINVLISSPQLLKAQEYKLALGDIFKKRKTIKQVLNDFCFLHYGYFGGKDLNIEMISQDLLEYRKNKKWSEELNMLKRYAANIKKQKEIIAKKYKLKQTTIYLLEFISVLTFWRDQRKILTQKTARTIKILGQEIAKRSNVPWADLCLCSPSGIDSIPVKKNILKKYHDLNKYNYFLYFYKNRFVKVGRKKYSKLLKYFVSSGQVMELKGQIACPGTVRGTVKIIHGPNDFKKLKKGDILVTTMTRPEFMPIVNRVSAIITDEGGITCHAAIISRELNIPCIIGTKIATKILKNGDLVEINDQEKIVKIIKHK